MLKFVVAVVGLAAVANAKATPEEMQLAETQAFCEKMGMSEIPLQVQFLVAMQEGGAADVDIQGPMNTCNICKNVVNGLIGTGAGGACGAACGAAGCAPCVPWCASICAAIATGATDAQWICSTVDLCKAPRGDDDWRIEDGADLPVLEGEDAKLPQLVGGPHSGSTGPAWTRGETEAPTGEKDMGGWVAAVYTDEQQQRLGVDEAGNKQGLRGAAA